MRLWVLSVLIWDPGDEERHRAGETISPFCMGTSAVRAPEDGGFGSVCHSTHCTAGGISPWAGGAENQGIQTNKMWSSPLTLLVGMQTSTATMENSVEIS